MLWFTLIPLYALSFLPAFQNFTIISLSPDMFKSIIEEIWVLVCYADEKDGLDAMALLNQLIEKQPGATPLSEVDPESLYIFGKMIDVIRKSILVTGNMFLFTFTFCDNILWHSTVSYVYLLYFARDLIMKIIVFILLKKIEDLLPKCFQLNTVFIKFSLQQYLTPIKCMTWIFIYYCSR